MRIFLPKWRTGSAWLPFAFYGYLKAQEDKHKLVVDPVAGAVVQGYLSSEAERTRPVSDRADSEYAWGSAAAGI